MKVRFASGRVRVRLDDLELAALRRGEGLTAEVAWPMGGWRVDLDPQAEGVSGEGGTLQIGLRAVLAELADPAREGVRLDGPPRVDVEKDFGPQHG